LTRQYIPFGERQMMRIAVPYSALLREGERAWTSGQIALDESRAVLAPGDIAAQAGIIAGNIVALLDEAGLGPSDVSRLVAYSAAHDGDRETAMEAVFADVFGSAPLIEIVPVPHFYYDGVLLEVDVFCAPSEPVIVDALPGGGKARVKREGELMLVNLTAPPNALGQAIGELLRRHALSPDQLLSGWGIAPEPILSMVPGQVAPRLPGFFSGALMPCYVIDDDVHLYLTFGVGEMEISEHHGERVRLHLARCGLLAVLDARYRGGREVSLDAQTEAVMAELAAVLAEHGMDFTDVVKSTTFYAGGNTADELHGNLEIRNRFYTEPGPASTGVPIARMADPGSKVRIELVLHPRAG
jgi:enamine deaminase RidA (YjgF/YER057c/UK114 family)